jgi:hypothetical protein
MKTTYLLLSCLATLSSALAELRDFTDTQGRKLNGEIVAVAGDQVQIKRSSDNRVIPVPLKLLSEGDQKFIKEYAANNTKYSFEVRATRTKLEASKGEKLGAIEVKLEEWAYKINMRNLSSADVSDARISYWLFHRSDDGKRKSRPRVQVEGKIENASIKRAANYEFVTTPVAITKTKLNAGYIYTDGSNNKSADSLGGFVIRIYQGDKEIYSYASDSELLPAAVLGASISSDSDK